MREPSPQLGITGYCGRALLAFVIVVAGCVVGPDHLGPIRAAFDSEGRLCLLARQRTSEDEGGGWSQLDLRFAVREGGQWSSQTISIDSEPASSFGWRYSLVIDSNNRPLIVTDTAQGIVALTPNGDEWDRVADRAVLPSDAANTLATPDVLGHAWPGADGRIRLIAGAWLYEIEDGRFVGAMATGSPCDPHNRDTFRDCLFSPTGDIQGQAAILDHTGSDVVTLQSLDCSDGECTWTTPRDSELGTMDLGGSSNVLRRSFFHLSDGTPVLVRPVRVESGENYALQANWPGGESTLIPENIYKAGARPRPGGGYYALTLSYDDEVDLVVVEPDWSARVISITSNTDLHTYEPLTVIGEQTAEDEHVHIFLGQSETTVDHFTVELAGDSIGYETLQL